MDEDTRLVPSWSRLLDASDFHGTFYKMTSPYPALWLQGKQAAHTIEFDVDGPGLSAGDAEQDELVSM